MCKLYYWVFRGLNTKAHLPTRLLQRGIGVLRWYSAVVPLSSTWELQRLLTSMQRKEKLKNRVLYYTLTEAAQRELNWWRWILEQNLYHPMLESPIWYLAHHNQSHRMEVHIYTDASTSVGGGYYIKDYCYGQFKWSEDEKLLYGTGDKTDINGLEFVTAICAIITNRVHLKNCYVILHVDNTSAVIWLNKQRTSHRFGQAWMHILISVMLEYNILLHTIHIPGIENTYADSLSRFLQDSQVLELTTHYKNMPIMSAASRETIWSMSSTPFTKKEYLQKLNELE